MDRKTIDRIVWWIPLKQLRDDIRDYMNTIYGLSLNSMRLANYIYEIDVEFEIEKTGIKYYDVYKTEINNKVLFYLPYFPSEYISMEIVSKRNFFDFDTLKCLNPYIPSNAVILDIGANIGNHTLYWGCVRKAKKIISFEPVKQTYEILKKNIELNYLGNIVSALNIGLGDKKENASLASFEFSNIGGAQINYDENGTVKVDLLDNIDLNTDKIDFIKIDVETFEINVVNGARKTILKYKPIIFIEVISSNFKEIKNIFNELGYTKHIGADDNKHLGGSNYLFFP